jgi:hypothetical protein
MTARSAAEWEAELGAAIRGLTGFDVPPAVGFFEAGLTSALVVAVHGQLLDRLGPDVPVTVFFTYPTRRSLAAYLAGQRAVPEGLAAPAGPPARWTAQSRRDLRSRIRQRKG